MPPKLGNHQLAVRKKSNQLPNLPVRPFSCYNQSQQIGNFTLNYFQRKECWFARCSFVTIFCTNSRIDKSSDSLKYKLLELIQGVVSCMIRNSVQVKTWTVSIITVVYTQWETAMKKNLTELPKTIGDMNAAEKQTVLQTLLQGYWLQESYELIDILFLRASVLFARGSERQDLGIASNMLAIWSDCTRSNSSRRSLSTIFFSRSSMP